MITLVSKKYVGGYNDTQVFDLELVVNGQRKILTAEKKYHDMQKTNFTWEITEIADYLTNEYKEKLLNFLNNEEKIKIGKEYTLNNSLNTKCYILEKKDNIALIRTLNEYVIASGIKMREDEKIEWSHGTYLNDLLEATLKFKERTENQIEQIQTVKNMLNTIPNFVMFSAIVENETENEKKQITEHDLKKLEILYDDYISNDFTSLISEEIIDRENDLNYNQIKSSIISYLKENDIDIKSISEDKIQEMIDDVLDEVAESSECPDTLIFIEDYLDGTLEELKSEEEEEFE